jgi:hypothetical protein
MVLMAGCGEAKPRPELPPPDQPPPSASPGAVPGVPLTETAIGAETRARIAGIAARADQACADQAATTIAGYRDARQRDWYHANCGIANGDVAVLVAGASGAAGVVYRGEGSEWTIEKIVIHDLPGAPLVCATMSWHIEKMLREGWDTVCVREVGGALAKVYEMGDTSLADGTDAAYEVRSGTPEEILDLVDCDDCEVCALEDDCTVVPPGVQRYTRRNVWDGTTFVRTGELTRP